MPLENEHYSANLATASQSELFVGTPELSLRQLDLRNQQLGHQLAAGLVYRYFSPDGEELVHLPHRPVKRYEAEEAVDTSRQAEAEMISLNAWIIRAVLRDIGDTTAFDDGDRFRQGVTVLQRAARTWDTGSFVAYADRELREAFVQSGDAEPHVEPLVWGETLESDKDRWVSSFADEPLVVETLPSPEPYELFQPGELLEGLEGVQRYVMNSVLAGETQEAIGTELFSSGTRIGHRYARAVAAVRTFVRQKLHEERATGPPTHQDTLDRWVAYRREQRELAITPGKLETDPEEIIYRPHEKPPLTSSGIPGLSYDAERMDVTYQDWINRYLDLLRVYVAARRGLPQGFDDFSSKRGLPWNGITSAIHTSDVFVRHGESTRLDHMTLLDRQVTTWGAYRILEKALNGTSHGRNPHQLRRKLFEMTGIYIPPEVMPVNTDLNPRPRG